MYDVQLNNILLEKPMQDDPVNSPSYYVKNAVVLEPYVLTGQLNSCIGQALQYLIRASDKENYNQDIRKAHWWLKHYEELGLPSRELSNEAYALVKLFKKYHPNENVRVFLRDLFYGSTITLESLKKAIVDLEGWWTVK